MEHGMLHDSGDIKLLILYILRDIAGGAEGRVVTDIIADIGGAPYFDAAEAIAGMLASGHVAREGADGLHTITPLGRETVELLEKNLPFTTRQKAQAGVMRAVRRMKADADLICSMEQCDAGYTVELGALELGDELFRLRLLVQNRMQAETVTKRFRERPEALYSAIIKTLTE